MCIRDSPLASGEVGQAGVAVDSLADMEALLDGIPLEKVSICLLYTSDAADERSSVDLGGRRIIKKKITAEQQQNLYTR